MAQLSLRLLLREAGRHSCEIHPSGMDERERRTFGLTILKVITFSFGYLVCTRGYRMHDGLFCWWVLEMVSEDN